MKFSTALFTACSLFSSVLALPQSTITPTGPTYFLRTCLTPGQENKTQYEGLYLWAYHTGAGLDDAVVGDRSYARPGFLNGTYQEFSLGGAFPWGLELGYLAPYTAWATVQINGGSGDGNYAINGSGLVVINSLNATNTEAYAWGGWRVCDWNHGVTQLFWVSQHYRAQAYPVPSSCADVDLVPEYLTS